MAGCHYGMAAPADVAEMTGKAMFEAFVAGSNAGILRTTFGEMTRTLEEGRYFLLCFPRAVWSMGD